MTNTKFKNVEEIKQARTEGKAAIFNVAAALSAADTVAPKTKENTGGAMGAAIVQLLSAADKPLAVNQIVAGLAAGGIADATSKKVSDAAWLLAKRGKITKVEGQRGLYAPLAKAE